ncbi:hypothetical protein BGZ98_009561 [Dissophora globulifera]|nr:hypothetical protein BGZ98_009561 [Dissophora globulifera]
MVPGAIQPKYHHYIPYFILKTFADNFSLSTSNYIASNSEVFLKPDLPPDWRLNGSGRRKKKGKGTNRRGKHLIKVYQVENQTTELNDADKSYGIEYMYRDITEDDCMRFENLLSKIESTSSIFIRKIWAGEDLLLTRVQLTELKKFLAIMTYRSENRRNKYHNDTFNLQTRASIRTHMHHKNIKNVKDVWFDNLKWFIKTPTEDIMAEYKNAMMGMKDLRTRAYKGPIHILELLDFGGACGSYMCIWEAEKGSEFILSEGCFGAWEGDIREPFHTFYVVSPRYCIVLVNRLELWSLARYLPSRSWFEGNIHAFPDTVYKNGLPPSTPNANFFSPEDVFKYGRIIIPKDDVYFVNSIFLDAREKCLTYNSSVSMYKTLRYYDMMKKIRPDLIKVDRVHNAEDGRNSMTIDSAASTSTASGIQEKEYVRAAERYTSGNTYRANEFSPPYIFEYEHTVSKKRKATGQTAKSNKKVKKEPHGKVKRDTASERAREEMDKGLAPDLATKTYKRNLGNMDGLEEKLRQLRQDIHQYIDSTIQEMVSLNTELLRCEAMAVITYVNSIMSSNPSISTSSVDIAIRRDSLQYIAHDRYGYFSTLIKAIYHIEDNIKASGTSFDAAVRTIKLFMAIPSEKDLARTWSQEWVTDQDGMALLDTIDEKGVSAIHDPVSLHWILNTVLPDAKRIVYVPMPVYKDCYCPMSALQDIEAVLRIGGDQAARADLVQIIGTLAKATCRYELRLLKAEPGWSTEYKEAKVKVKYTIKRSLLELDANTRACKYALDGTLLTDGHQTKILAYSLVRPKKKAKDSSTPPSAPTKDSMPSPSSPTSTRSKFKDIRAAIPNPETLQDDILAIDSGIVKTATAVIVDSSDVGKSWNMSFSRRSHTLHSRIYNKMMDRAKKDMRHGSEGIATIQQVELGVHTLECRHDTNSDLPTHHANLTTNFKLYAESVLIAMPLLLRI